MNAELVEKTRSELKTQGWSLLDTTEYISDIPHPTSGCYSQDGHRYFTYVDPVLEKFLQDLMASAVPDEPHNYDETEFRWQPSEMLTAKTRSLSEVSKWHADGGYIRALTPLIGKGTEYKPSPDSEEVLEVPLLHTLLFTANYRTQLYNIPATPHRMPHTEDERKFFVTTFGVNETKVNRIWTADGYKAAWRDADESRTETEVD